MRATHRLHLGLILLLSAALTHADGGQRLQDESFYDDQARGWFWHEARPSPAPAPPAQPPVVSRGGEGSNEPSPLSAAWFRLHLDSYRDLALDNPTPENVERYQLLQRYAMDKADRFSQVWTDVVNSNPLLDESNERPRTALQKRTVSALVRAARAAVLAKISNETGMWYFFRSDCPYCHRQNEPLLLLQRLHNFTILPISLDGMGMGDGAFDDFAVNDGHAERAGVSVTPTLILVKPPNQIERLSVGLKTTDDIEDLILDTARRAGWISETEFTQATQGVAPTYLTDRLSGEQLEDDPDALLLALRRASEGIGGGTPWVSGR